MAFFLLYGHNYSFFVTGPSSFSLPWAQLLFFVTGPGSFPLLRAQLFFFVTGTGSFSLPWAQLSFTDHPHTNLQKHKKTTISGCLRFAWQRPTLTGTRVPTTIGAEK
ncbi:hypothetical protein AB7942_24900, partial [Neobacillus sp. BF23-41]